MTKLLLKVVPDSGDNQFSFFFGKLTVILSFQDTPDLPKGGSFSLYNDQLYLLHYAEAGDKQIVRKDNAFKVAFKESSLWIPGAYFLLFRSGDTILRFDLQLDTQGSFTETGVRPCLKLSDEDILSGNFPCHSLWLNQFSCTPGFMQLKRWAITRMQHRAFNGIRSLKGHGTLEYNNNVLISSPSSEYLNVHVLVMKYLAEINCETRDANAATLCNPSSGDSFYEIEQLFRKDEETEFNDLHLPSLKDRLFIIGNIDALLEPKAEPALKRVLSYCPSYYDSVFFTGTPKAIETLLEREPYLQDRFPQYNRLSVEPYTLDEVIRLFFREVEQVRLKFSPEATDVACHWLSERYQQGAYRHWTRREVRHYLQDQVIPAYTRRAISAIQQGTTPTEVLDIQPEDLGLENTTKQLS